MDDTAPPARNSHQSGHRALYYVGSSPRCQPFRVLNLPLKLSVVPQGMEEGSELLIEEKEFGLMTGQPAEFRFLPPRCEAVTPLGQIIPNAEASSKKPAASR